MPYLDSLTIELQSLIATQRERLQDCESRLRELRVRLDHVPDALTLEAAEAEIVSIRTDSRRYQAFLDVLSEARENVGRIP